MEQELRFGLDLGRLALLKKKIKHCSIRPKKLYKMKFKEKKT